MTRLGWSGVALASCWILGCGCPSNLEGVRQEALKADPRFADALAHRDELAERIALMERELALKKSQIDQQIVKLRKEFGDTRQQVQQKIQHTKLLLKPEHDRLAFALSMATEELKAKRYQRASLGRAISRLRKTLNDRSAQWTPSERSRMDKERDEAMQEAQRLDHEINALTQHLQLLKRKRLLLRL